MKRFAILGLVLALPVTSALAQNYYGAGSTTRVYPGSYANTTPRYIAPPPQTRYQPPPLTGPGSTLPPPRYIAPPPYAGSTPMYPRSFGGSTMPVRPPVRR